MDQLPLLDAWREVLLQIAAEFSNRVVAFVPSLIGAVLILLLGWLIARVLESGSARALRAFGFDRAVARLRLDAVLERAGVRMLASKLVSKVLFWLLMFTFLLSSAEILGFSAVTVTLDRLVAFIPNLASAAVTMLAGLLFARFVGSLVSSAGPAGFPGAQRLGFLVWLLIASVVVIVAIEQLGIETSVFVLPFTAVLTAAALSVGLAFALGAYPIVTHILAGHFLKSSLPRDVFVEVGGERGMVERVGAVDTVLRDGEHAWSVPNAKLLDLIVKR